MEHNNNQAPAPRHGRHGRSIQPSPTQTASLTQAGPAGLKVVLSILSVLTLIVSGLGYTFIGRLGGDLASVTGLALSDGSKGLRDGNFTDGALDILLVGSDSRTDAQGNSLSEAELAALHAGVDGGEENTDTIMVIRIPADGSRATAISIPRDTYINDGSYGNMKINGVYSSHAAAVRETLVEENTAAEAAGQSIPHDQKEIDQQATAAGRQALLAQVKDLTGIEIDHYAEVGLVGFVLLTDAVGGVEVCLNNEVNDDMSGAHFPAGVQTLNGAQGLAYVRQRYELPRGDLDRIVRQQSYAASLVSKILSSGTLSNPAKLNAISNAVERSLVIDENWDIMKLASQLSGLAGGNVVFETIPVTSIDGVGDYGESIVTIDKQQVHQFFDDLAKTEDNSATAEASAAPEVDPNLKPVAEGMELHVLNAGGIAGLAGSVANWMQKVGYSIHTTGNAEPGLYGHSQILAANPRDSRAHDLAEQLGGLPVEVNEGLDDNTLIIVIGEDYTGPSLAVADNAAGQLPQADSAQTIGTPGEDFGTADVSPEINAGGGPRCVN